MAAGRDARERAGLLLLDEAIARLALLARLRGAVLSIGDISELAE